MPQRAAPAPLEDATPLARASRCYPLVGALVGVIAALIFLAADRLGLPPGLAALSAIVATVLVTGALHEDGLADLADGFGGGGDRARKLAIMRDSRIGSYGVIALILALALRAGSLAAIAEPGAVAAALIAAESLSRGGLAAIMAGLPPARPDGLAAHVGRPGGSAALAAILIAAALAFVLLDWQAAVLSLLALVAAQGLVALLARRQIGGYTGDVLGAAQQIGATAILLVLAAAAP
ncbi:adenosylcobinamide-GDP ribazoletransferase [Pelagibius litoralis]|uniref:Adenosylcobinamide-GDP ribazoletransferase n=2 Tax=Pelagibius litoralis TaxID=374515 RepID=A0A967CB44_9PROT|nr:adenosylcobinamide-GDP ribazoletransferase [Pelagibius litoralis]